ncbi:glycosyltransferase [Acetobacter fallax]|uniref:Glycosyltransferase n=1 Tax=Acetobacter fallax TaxID=1737473 RepID=A0ABX0KJF4_9PROT|nr:glycosyltransferase [Acetobacter fallax]NHO34022.1 glycosyltransferase [Acetobacter fallax]NHO37556.1 glycosyltransferase [Acetobacter fallax]
MRILVVSNFFPPFVVGGAEIVADRHARELQRRGHDVFIVGGRVPAPGYPAGSMEPEDHNGLPIQRITLRSLDPDQSFRWPVLTRRLISLILMHDIEVVHFHNIIGLGADCIQAVKELGLPCVVTLHDHWGFCLRQSLLRENGTPCRHTEGCSVCLPGFVYDEDRLPVRLRRDYIAWCLEQADHLISPSSYLAKAYNRAGIASGRIQVLSNGIDLGNIPQHDYSAQNAGNHPLRFLCSAYLGPHKGIDVLLEALSLLAEDPELTGRWEMTLAGQGPLHQKAEKLALRKNIPLIVTGHLPRRQLLQDMARSDVVVLPSVWPENEPVTLLEGGAAGAALLVSRSGGAADMVQDGDTGLTVPPGDAKALALAMRRFITEPGLAARMGAKNLTRRSQFDETRTVTQLENIYSGKTEPDTTVSPRPVVILTGEGTAPDAIITLTDHLHDYLTLPASFRLLRHDWVNAEAWENAQLLWLWNEKNALPVALNALRRNIPILAPAGIGLEDRIRTGAPVLLYRTPLEALAHLQILLEKPGIRSYLADNASVAADAVWSSPGESFALRAEQLD